MEVFLFTAFETLSEDIHCSIDDGKNKNIFSTPTSSEKGDGKNKY